MKVDNLYEEFPLLYKERIGSDRSPFALFGFELRDGWYPLLRELSEGLEPLFRNCPAARVAQVKEKFGGLRFYIDGGTDAIYELIDAAETKSLRTCDQCGAEGERRGGGWVRTLCEVCDEKRNKK